MSTLIGDNSRRFELDLDRANRRIVELTSDVDREREGRVRAESRAEQERAGRVRAEARLDQIATMQDSDFSVLVKMAFIKMALTADDQHRATVSRETIARASSISVKSRKMMIDAAKEIEDAGLAKVVRSPGKTTTFEVCDSATLDSIVKAYAISKHRVDSHRVLTAPTTGCSQHPLPGAHSTRTGCSQHPVDEKKAPQYNRARAVKNIIYTTSLSHSETEAARDEIQKRADEEELSEGLYASATVIRCPALGWKVDLRAVDLAAGVTPLGVEKGRVLAKVMAIDWAANSTTPQSPMAMIRKAIGSQNVDEIIARVRIDKAATGGGFPTAQGDPDSKPVMTIEFAKGRHYVTAGDLRRLASGKGLTKESVWQAARTVQAKLLNGTAKSALAIEGMIAKEAARGAGAGIADDSAGSAEAMYSDWRHAKGVV